VPFVVEDNTTNTTTNNNGDPFTWSNEPLDKMIHASLGSVGDADARKELCGNIVLCGGGASSMTMGMEQRLSYEVANTVSGFYKTRVVASRNTVERTFAPWIGASILTSLGSFQQLWLTKQEYEEYGPYLSIQRFP